MPGIRDDFSNPVKRELEYRVGSVCSKPGCGQLTRGPKIGEIDKSYSIGEAGHIAGASPGGPRYDSTMTRAQRVAFENGIWLCIPHHRLVDRDSSPYDAITLRQWKLDAETKARRAIELGEARAGFPSLVSVLHKSMEHIPNDSLRRSMPSIFENSGNREVVIDACDLYLGGSLTDPREAMRRQVIKRDELTGLLALHPSVDIAYYGIAHIPLAVHFGYLVSTKIAPHFAEKERTTEVWRWLNREAAQVVLNLRRPEVSWQSSTDAVIRIGVSYPVLPEQTDPVIVTPATFDLGLEDTGIDKIRSRKEVEMMAETFRVLLDEIAAVTSVQRIHIFASVPMSVAFSLGQQISSSIHPKVFVYNYRRLDSPYYKWGLLMTDDTAALDAVKENP